MAVPTVHQMLRPILAMACEEGVTRRGMAPAIADHFKLGEADRAEKIPSGLNKIGHRAGWAITYLTKARLVEKTAPITYGATDKGRQFLAEHPNEITRHDLEAIPGWKAAWETKRTKERKETSDADQSDQTPEEALDAAAALLDSDVKDRLMSAILAQSPTFFEKLVLDVLVAMGYGGTHAEAAEHLGKSGDEGIDGRINQDRLGLDQILVQAKRYSSDNVVDRHAIQAFIGSMTGQGVTKGIFITTSSFNANAQEFVLRGSNIKLVLIDGDELLNLMLRHRIGTRVQRTVNVLDLDQNYFSEDD